MNVNNNNVPVTYCFPWFSPDAAKRRANLEMLREHGIENLVLRSEDLQNFLREPELFIAVSREMKEAGVRFCDAHAPWGDWSDPGIPVKECRSWIVARQKCAIAFTGAAGVTTLTSHTGNVFPDLYGKHAFDEYYGALTASLEELLPVAEHAGVILALENQWTPLNHSRHLLRIMEEFRSPYLGLCCDTGHANLTEKGRSIPGGNCVPPFWAAVGKGEVEWEENLIEKFSPWLVNCHLHDNDGYDDRHWMPGKGNIDWKRIMSVLARSPRLRSIQSEVRVEGGDAARADELRNVFDSLVTAYFRAEAE